MQRIIFALALTAFAGRAQAEQYLVRSQVDYAAATKALKPGDVVILADGEWRDFEISLSGRGEQGKPITLKAEMPGKVVLTGKSNLRIGGSHIVVTGLVFRAGYSPTGEVISFRLGKDDLATDSRVTETVIDHFNQPDRFQSDYWVAMYGKRNRFDHNNLVGKSNQGVTLAVRLDGEGSRENGHRIDHNYFGPRPILGSNGGESLRIGTSAYSMFNSNTVVEDNVFDRCDGEVEIVSIKSGQNVVRRNLILQSRGSIVLRHGDGNIVERNIFLGNGKDHTGGIRVINRRQTVRDNYMEGLRGTGFASALTVMNGIPNSPIYRYVQVADATITNNTIVNSARVSLAAGADAERTAAPVNSVFERNLLVFDSAENPVEIQDDISGIAFKQNLIANPKATIGLPGATQKAINLKRAENGLLYPADPKLRAIGAPRDLQTISLDAVGAPYYAKAQSGGTFGAGAKIAVAAGGDNLAAAFAMAHEGDRLVLAAGDYPLDRTLIVDKAITIEAAPGARPHIRFRRDALFELAERGNLKLQDLDIDGAEAVDYQGNAMIRTSRLPIIANFQLELDGVHVRDLKVNANFDVIRLGKSTLAGRLRIANSSFENISGKVVEADGELDNFGRYNIEYLEVVKSTFKNINDTIASLYRGGNDESTFGPHVLFEDNIVEAVKAPSGSLVLHGAQQALIQRNTFTDSAPIRITQTTGDPPVQIIGNHFTKTSPPEITEVKFRGPHRVVMAGNTFDGVQQ